MTIFTVSRTVHNRIGNPENGINNWKQACFQTNGTEVDDLQMSGVWLLFDFNDSLKRLVFPSVELEAWISRRRFDHPILTRSSLSQK